MMPENCTEKMFCKGRFFCLTKKENNDNLIGVLFIIKKFLYEKISRGGKSLFFWGRRKG